MDLILKIAVGNDPDDTGDDVSKILPRTDWCNA
jgi:hypothetical protein